MVIEGEELSDRKIPLYGLFPKLSKKLFKL